MSEGKLFAWHLGSNGYRIPVKVFRSIPWGSGRRLKIQQVAPWGVSYALYGRPRFVNPTSVGERRDWDTITGEIMGRPPSAP